jgi:hypothetical protein
MTLPVLWYWATIQWYCRSVMTPSLPRTTYLPFSLAVNRRGPSVIWRRGRDTYGGRPTPACSTCSDVPSVGLRETGAAAVSAPVLRCMLTGRGYGDGRRWSAACQTWGRGAKGSGVEIGPRRVEGRDAKGSGIGMSPRRVGGRDGSSKLIVGRRGPSTAGGGSGIKFWRGMGIGAVARGGEPIGASGGEVTRALAWALVSLRVQPTR